MIILKLTDGLGNQMFQYAYGRYIQTEYGETKMYLDITKLNGNHVRSYGLSHFKLNDNVIIPSRFFQYASRFYVKILLNLFYRVFKVSTKTDAGVRTFSRCGLYTNSNYYCFFPFYRSFFPIKFVRGFFQNESYFQTIRDVIRSEFCIKEEYIRASVIEMARMIDNNEAVCVHVRRGDYIKYKRFNICTEEYYKNGMAIIKEKFPNATFYVFSNTNKDVEWIKNNYSLGVNVRYVDMGYNEIEDFYLMTHCRHFVISNSTFSWWAAYLCKDENKIVVAPKPWVNSDDMQDGVYCSGWHIINVKQIANEGLDPR